MADFVMTKDDEDRFVKSWDAQIETNRRMKILEQLPTAFQEVVKNIEDQAYQKGLQEGLASKDTK